MYEAWMHDRYVEWALWGRFALAIVSRRARICPRRTCGRSRRCLARFGGPNASLHAETADCPIMSKTEWRSVSAGIRGNWSLLGPWQIAQRDKKEAEDKAKEKTMSREERLRLRAERDAAAARRRQQGEPLREYALMLWLQVRDDTVGMPRDVAAAGETLIALRLAHGCRCAAAGRLECADEAECLRRRGRGRIANREWGGGSREEGIANSFGAGAAPPRPLPARGRGIALSTALPPSPSPQGEAAAGEAASAGAGRAAHV